MASVGRHSFLFCTVTLGSAIAFAPSSPAAETHTEQSTCSADIHISAEEGAHSALVCVAVSVARELMQNCGFEQKRPITIKIVPAMDREHEACAAFFNCDTDVLTVVSPEALARSDQVLDAFARLPADEYFQSVIVHELAHAFLSQSQHGMMSRVGHEYFAYSIQIASLPEGERAKIFDYIALEAIPSAINFYESLLDFRPSTFALWSFLHFSHPDNGCAFVQRIVERDLSLPEAFLRRDVGSRIDWP